MLTGSENNLPELRQQLIGHTQKGMWREAVSLAEVITKQAVDDFTAWETLAALCLQLDMVDRLTEACTQMVRLQPQTARVHFNLALALYKSGKKHAAINSYRNALQLDPHDAEVHYNLGLICHEVGETGDAIFHYRNALHIRPDWPEAQNNLAQALKDTGDYQTAINLLRNAVKVHPERIRLLHTLGEIHDLDCQFDLAMDAYRHALQLEPRNTGTYIRSGRTLLRAGRPDEAEEYYRQALRLEPENIDVKLNQIEILEVCGKYQQACAHLQILLDKYPFNHSVALKFADLCRHMNRCAEAVDNLKRLAEATGTTAEAKRKIHFSLGKLLDQSGDYDTAFENFRTANKLKHRHFDSGRFAAIIQTLIEAFSSDTLRSLPRSSIDSSGPRPVFIVGMPRSGTSLLEQIIDTHTQCQGAGELDFVSRLVADMASPPSDKAPYPAGISSLTGAQITEFRNAYLRKIAHLYSGSPRLITDKMPENFLHLGLIELLFPDALIIHCVRNPLDTCLSCYFQEFSGTHNYAYDLNNIGAYYHLYRKLMQHWKQVLTLPVFTVCYEDMVNDTEGTCRRLFESLELDWENQCLDFHASSRLVVTASQHQVKEPLYNTSINRWKHYQAYLDPLRHAIEKGF